MNRRKRLSKTRSLVKYDRILAGGKYSNKIFADASTHPQYERTHPEEKPFKCYQCDKSYLNEYNLNKHAKIHAKLKPYQCKVCGLRYNRKDVLKLHTEEHENGFFYEANRKTLDSPVLTRSSYKLRFCRSQINQNNSESELTTSGSEVSYISDSDTRTSNTSTSNSSTSNADSFNLNDDSKTISKIVEYKKNEYLKKLHDNICKNQPIVKLVRLSKKRLNSILNPMVQKVAKIETLNDHHHEFNFNFIFDNEIQIELEEVYNEIQRAINPLVDNAV